MKKLLYNLVLLKFIPLPNCWLLSHQPSTILCRWHVQQRNQGRLHQSPVTHRVVLYFIKHTVDYFPDVLCFFSTQMEIQNSSSKPFTDERCHTLLSRCLYFGCCPSLHPETPKNAGTAPSLYCVDIQNAIEIDACRHRYVTPFSISEPNRGNTFSVTKFIDSKRAFRLLMTFFCEQQKRHTWSGFLV